MCVQDETAKSNGQATNILYLNPNIFLGILKNGFILLYDWVWLQKIGVKLPAHSKQVRILSKQQSKSMRLLSHWFQCTI